MWVVVNAAANGLAASAGILLALLLWRRQRPGAAALLTVWAAARVASAAAWILLEEYGRTLFSTWVQRLQFVGLAAVAVAMLAGYVAMRWETVVVLEEIEEEETVEVEFLGEPEPSAKAIILDLAKRVETLKNGTA